MAEGDEQSKGASRGQLIIFWSWQTDSPKRENRNFIEDCLGRAAKKIAKHDELVVAVDRDTEDIGGAPGIAETILRKIRSADVFVWDATLVYASPRPAPNPNVLLEFGYALAVLGENKLVGVMNTARGSGPEKLPFDLTHRRWPLQYRWRDGGWFGRLQKRFLPSGGIAKPVVRDELVGRLEAAIRAAANEPKRSAFQSDAELHAARNLWRVLNSRWMANWHQERTTYPQWEHRHLREVLSEYVHISQLPENQFEAGALRRQHADLVAALTRYLATLAREMVPDRGNTDTYVISMKLREWGEVPDHDAKYQRQVDAVTGAADAVWSAWVAYVDELKRRYPEATSSAE